MLGFWGVGSSNKLGPRVGPYSLFWGVQVPVKSPLNQKGTLFIPRLLVGLVNLQVVQQTPEFTVLNSGPWV